MEGIVVFWGCVRVGAAIAARAESLRQVVRQGSASTIPIKPCGRLMISAPPLRFRRRRTVLKDIDQNRNLLKGSPVTKRAPHRGGAQELGYVCRVFLIAAVMEIANVSLSSRNGDRLTGAELGQRYEASGMMCRPI